MLDRILKNGFASLLEKTSKIAEQLLLVPFFIMHWGLDYYGDWISLTILPSFLALANLGFGTATGNSFVLKYSGNDKKGAASTVKTGLHVMHYGIIFILILCFIFLNLLDYFSVFSNLELNAQDAKLAVFFMFVAAVLDFYLSIFECFFRVAYKAHLGILLKAISTYIKVLLCICVLYLGAKAFEFAITVFLITLITNIIYIYLSIKVLNFKEYKASVYDKNQALFLFKKGFGYFLSPLWQAIYFQGTTLVIRIVLGPSAVVLFNTLRTLINSSSQFFSIVVNAIYPEYQLLIAKNDQKTSNKLYSYLLFVNVILSFIMMLGFLLFGNLFYNWWTNNLINVPSIIWFLMIIRIFFYALWYSNSFVFEARNMPYYLTVTGLIVSILSVGVTWVSSIFWGVAGGAVGILFFDILMFIVLRRLSANLISIELKDGVYIIQKMLSKLKKV